MITLTPREFLDHLRSLDVRVSTEGERLKVSAPAGTLTPELKEELIQRKPEILAVLSAIRAWEHSPYSIVPIQPSGSRTPVYGCPGHNGDVFCYVRLARHLGGDQPFYALQPPGLDGKRPPLERVEELAARYVEDLVTFQPNGPLVLMGFCLGGAVAFETARQLLARGRDVSMLFLLASSCPTTLWRICRTPANILSITREVLKKLSQLHGREKLRYLTEKATNLLRRRNLAPPEPQEEAVHYRVRVEEATASAVANYRPQFYPGPVTMLLPSEEWRYSFDRLMDWKRFTGPEFEVRAGPEGCDGNMILLEPSVLVFARILTSCLERLPQGSSLRRGGSR